MWACLSVESRSNTRSRPFGTEFKRASTWGMPQNPCNVKVIFGSKALNLVKHEEPALHQPNSLIVARQPFENCSSHAAQVVHRAETTMVIHLATLRCKCFLDLFGGSSSLNGSTL